MFLTDMDEVWGLVDAIDPVAYARTRNHLNGAVTRLSPYISRGILSTKQVMQTLLAKGRPLHEVEKLVQELAWRDHWQMVWRNKGHAIFEDIRQPQATAERRGLPKAILEASTGIAAIDQGIRELERTGYMHNHLRMYTAMLCCHIARCHWEEAARWLHYHLLDADAASNALSWQWIAGTNSHQPYLANQGNIDHHYATHQPGTYLDGEVEELLRRPIPAELREVVVTEWKTPMPSPTPIALDPQKPTLIYNWYNLDQAWLRDWDANRVLLLEPSAFERHPICERSVNWMLAWAGRIAGMQVFVGEYRELAQALRGSEVHFKEHPMNRHYTGTEHPRDWMFAVAGDYPSFSAFWKQCKKELQSEQKSPITFM